MNQAAVLILVYPLAMLIIGPWGIRIRDVEDFHLAGWSLRLILPLGTFCATIVGAYATLGVAGFGFIKGLPGSWWMLSGTLCLLIMAAFLSRR